MADPARKSTEELLGRVRSGSSSASVADAAPTHGHRASLASLNSDSGVIRHRSSFAENLRSHPPSPRQRHPSFTQAAVQELLSHHSAKGDPRFAGRDWRQISVGELVSRKDVHFVELDTGVEEATKLLVECGPPNVVLVRETTSDTTACSTFDYNDLNAYLLVVLGLAHPDEDDVETFTSIAKKAQEGTLIPLKDVKTMSKQEPIVTLPESRGLSDAIESFAGGVHRIIIVKEDTNEVVGILSQLRLVRFLWENGQSFPMIDQLYPVTLKDLGVGTHHAIAINGDKLLTEALQIMSNEGLTSLAVVDAAQNVVGNISTVDVKHLTNTSSLPLLQSSCIHFVSRILSERGVENGKDSFPVFHVNPYSTLAHTVAKLVATTSHRMWVVESASASASPSPSAPGTPSASSAVLASPMGAAPLAPLTPPPSQSPHPHPHSHTHTSAAAVAAAPPAMQSVPASALSGTRISGRLTGVISLTDILNLFARRSGLNPADPGHQREMRRRSSSSSLRPSLDSPRSSSMDIRR